MVSTFLKKYMLSTYEENIQIHPQFPLPLLLLPGLWAQVLGVGLLQGEQESCFELVKPQPAEYFKVSLSLNPHQVSNLMSRPNCKHLQANKKL